MQSIQIEEVLARHDVEGQVAGGRVQAQAHGQQVTFDVRATVAAGWERLQALKRDLKNALGGLDVQVERESGRLRVNLLQRGKAPVELLDVLETLDTLPPLTAVLGWSLDQRPVLLDLDAAETCHALIAGREGAGKTMLLRSLALSLALTNKEPRLQLAVIDPADGRRRYEHSELRPFNYLPHMLTPFIDNAADANELLQFLVAETNHRSENGITQPAVVVLIDAVEQVLKAEDTPALGALTQLIMRGAAAGIHLILSTRFPAESGIENLLEAYIPARLVGRLHNAAQAEVATEVLDSQAEHLHGRGDFLAIAGGLMTNFQVAHVGDYDLHLCLEQLHRYRPPALLAQTFDTRPALQLAEPLTEYNFVYAEDHYIEEAQTEAPAGEDGKNKRGRSEAPPPPVEDAAEECITPEDDIPFTWKSARVEPTGTPHAPPENKPEAEKQPRRPDSAGRKPALPLKSVPDDADDIEKPAAETDAPAPRQPVPPPRPRRIHRHRPASAFKSVDRLLRKLEAESPAAEEGDAPAAGQASRKAAAEAEGTPFSRPDDNETQPEAEAGENMAELAAEDLAEASEGAPAEVELQDITDWLGDDEDEEDNRAWLRYLDALDEQGTVPAGEAVPESDEAEETGSPLPEENRPAKPPLKTPFRTMQQGGNKKIRRIRRKTE